MTINIRINPRINLHTSLKSSSTTIHRNNMHQDPATRRFQFIIMNGFREEETAVYADFSSDVIYFMGGMISVLARVGVAVFEAE